MVATRPLVSSTYPEDDTWDETLNQLEAKIGTEHSRPQYLQLRKSVNIARSLTLLVTMMTTISTMISLPLSFNLWSCPLMPVLALLEEAFVPLVIFYLQSPKSFNTIQSRFQDSFAFVTKRQLVPWSRELDIGRSQNGIWPTNEIHCYKW